jgi:hypothetical protein
MRVWSHEAFTFILQVRWMDTDHGVISKKDGYRHTPALPGLTKQCRSKNGSEKNHRATAPSAPPGDYN